MHFYAYANILVALILAHPNPYAKGDINSLLKVSVISCKKPFGVFRIFLYFSGTFVKVSLILWDFNQ